MDIELARYLLPEGLLEYFDIVSDKSTADKIHFYLEEKNILPQEYKTLKAQSKGFISEITIEDFPLRGKTVLLHIKRRRWLNKTTHKVVQRDWNLVAKGTRMTVEFAVFLKALGQY